jgi:hypothetical protein
MTSHNLTLEKNNLMDAESEVQLISFRVDEEALRIHLMI